MPTNLDYLLRGCSNGHPVRFQGRGALTGRRLRIAVRPTESALDFDHSLALASCTDQLLALASGLVEPPHHDGLVARTRAEVLGEGGVAVGTLVVLATVARRKSGLAICAQLAEASVAMEVGEKVMSVEARTIRVLPTRDATALASAATVSTSRGRELTLLLTTRLNAGSARKHLALQAIRIHRVRNQASVQ